MPCLYGSSSGICVTVCMGPFLILTDRAVLVTLAFGQDPPPHKSAYILGPSYILGPAHSWIIACIQDGGGLGLVHPQNPWRHSFRHFWWQWGSYGKSALYTYVLSTYRVRPPHWRGGPGTLSHTVLHADLLTQTPQLDLLPWALAAAYRVWMSLLREGSGDL